MRHITVDDTPQVIAKNRPFLCYTRERPPITLLLLIYGSQNSQSYISPAPSSKLLFTHPRFEGEGVQVKIGGCAYFLCATSQKQTFNKSGNETNNIEYLRPPGGKGSRRSQRRPRRCFCSFTTGMTIAHTRFYKSRVGEFFCFPIGVPAMGVVKHATLPSECQRLQNALPARKEQIWGLGDAPNKQKSGWVAPRHCLPLLYQRLIMTVLRCLSTFRTD